jgi:hypothetical protein
MPRCSHCTSPSAALCWSPWLIHRPKSPRRCVKSEESGDFYSGPLRHGALSTGQMSDITHRSRRDGVDVAAQGQSAQRRHQPHRYATGESPRSPPPNWLLASPSAAAVHLGCARGVARATRARIGSSTLRRTIAPVRAFVRGKADRLTKAIVEIRYTAIIGASAALVVVEVSHRFAGRE